MTNREKFEEVFQPLITGQTLQGCLVCPDEVCEACTDCKDCSYDDWWEHEYKEKKEEKAMTRAEVELLIVEKIKEIKEIALKYDKTIESLSMAVRHYDGTEEYFDNEWVINFHADNHALDAFVQGGEVYSSSTGEVIAEGVTV
ncbi:MAG: hypothetical protein IKE94_05540 [Aeriscardovia sp.]|nr:hypothetical protein [Aeriscardovia sp.]MBR6843454.1 hypothetical protein [Prevotella sp.]